MNNTISDDKSTIECEREENNNYSSSSKEKRMDIPEWNESLQKIIVGYH